MPASQKPAGPSPTEILSVLAALRILTRWELDQYTLPEAVAHLRATYSLRRRGLRDYILAVMGEIAQSPAEEFRLFRRVDCQQEVSVPEEEKPKRLVDYLVDNFDQRNIPVRIEHGENSTFYL